MHKRRHSFVHLENDVRHENGGIDSVRTHYHTTVIILSLAWMRLLKDSRTRLAGRQDQSEKIDVEYTRLGIKNIFVFVKPRTRCYHAKASDSRAATDWTYEIKNIVHYQYKDAKKGFMVTI